ncbi:MAG: YHS domain-containing protein [Dehalococcoidia bacterium]
MAAMVKDVVCGMDVDPETAPAQSEYHGTTYYFCARGCKVDFDGDPQKYLSPDSAPAGMSAATTAKRWWEFWR